MGIILLPEIFTLLAYTSAGKSQKVKNLQKIILSLKVLQPTFLLSILVSGKVVYRMFLLWIAMSKLRFHYFWIFLHFFLNHSSQNIGFTLFF